MSAARPLAADLARLLALPAAGRAAWLEEHGDDVLSAADALLELGELEERAASCSILMRSSANERQVRS